MRPNIHERRFITFTYSTAASNRALINSKPTVQEGSWKCPKCNNINYPFRTKCNRQHCGAERPSESNEPRGLTSDEDEQVCKCVAPDAFYSMLLFLYSKLSIDEMNNTPSDLFGCSVRFLIPVFLNFAHCLLHGLMFKYATVTVSPKNKLSGSRRFRVVFGVTLVSKVHSVITYGPEQPLSRTIISHLIQCPHGKSNARLNHKFENERLSEMSPFVIAYANTKSLRRGFDTKLSFLQILALSQTRRMHAE
ncbi:hypothetical protein KSP39_PZI001720 [Platanthera zijinensis]|uniref:RanBP2-type domain-containing protein n=1 Tax=Platanthera zijinensis TaxID=2320716 RepID=A0AAP0GDY2_9ASPA